MNVACANGSCTERAAQLINSHPPVSAIRSRAEIKMQSLTRRIIIFAQEGSRKKENRRACVAMRQIYPMSMTCYYCSPETASIPLSLAFHLALGGIPLLRCRSCSHPEKRETTRSGLVATARLLLF